MGTVQPDEAVLTEIGLAVLRLRRMWAKPGMLKMLREETSAGPGGRPLQLSNLLVVQAVAGLSRDEDGEVTVGAVAERLEVDPSTASRLVGHAIDAGLVSRRPSPADARRANLGLTGAGQRVKQVADRFRRAYLRELTDGWTDEERAEFARLLTRFTEAAARVPLYPGGVGRIFEEAEA